MFLIYIGFKVLYYGQPLDWQREIIGLVSIIVFGVILSCVIWYVFVRERKVNIRNIRRKQVLEYYCPACQHSWDADNMPIDGICPRDGVPLKSYDPVEDRNKYSL